MSDFSSARSFFPLDDGVLVSRQVDVARVPYSECLDANDGSLIPGSLHMTYDIEPGADVDLMALNELEDVLYVHVSDLWGARRRVVMNEA